MQQIVKRATALSGKINCFCKNTISIPYSNFIQLKNIKSILGIRDVWILKSGCFFGKLPKGGGVISYPKNYIADFLVSKRYILVVNFGKNVQKGGRGGVISNPKNFIANLRKLAHIYELSQKKAQCNSQKVTGEGGVKAVWGFYKKTSIFRARDVPKINTSMMREWLMHQVLRGQCPDSSDRFFICHMKVGGCER